MKKLFSVLLSLMLLISPLSVSLGVVSASAEEPPVINASINMFDHVTSECEITVSFEGANGKSLLICETVLDGKVISSEPQFSFVVSDHLDAYGSYSLVLRATDDAGVSATSVITFYYAEKTDINFYYNESEEIIPSEPSAVAATYEVFPFEYTMGYGTSADGNITPDEGYTYCDYTTFCMKHGGVAADTYSVSGIPYQRFDISLDGKTEGELAIRYSGNALTGESVALKVWNPADEDWDTIGCFNGSGSRSEMLDIATYNDNGSIHVLAILDYCTNGSDTIIWTHNSSDNTEIYNYAAEKYKAGEAGYVINSGSLVKDFSSDEQWLTADGAVSILEEAGVPNGILAGYNDVNGESADYSVFSEYFPTERFNGNQWYYPGVNSSSHFDLVTIGNVDFIMLYLGAGEETSVETIAWANNILDLFSHRVAVIITDNYSDSSVGTNECTEKIYSEIISNHTNVRAVLCGSDTESKVNEKDLYGVPFYEIFTKNTSDGYVNLLSVNGDTLSGVCYSPATGEYNESNSFSIDLALEHLAPYRFISTNAFSAYTVGEENNDSPWLAEYGMAIIITGTHSTTYHHISYNIYPEEPEAGEDAHVDAENFALLIERAEALDTAPYTDESVAVFEEALAAAKAIADIRTAYITLSYAMGGLVEKAPVKNGDVDGNGTVNMMDCLLVKTYIFRSEGLSDEQITRADINKDGNVNMFDYLLIKSAYFA